MAKKEKDALSIDAQRAKEQKEAKQKIKEAEKAKPGAKEKDKAGAQKAGGKKTGKKVARWLRDFRGELKKIVWPDFKTVMKNTGIVLVAVVIIGTPVWLIDLALTRGIGLMKTVAAGASFSQEEDPFEVPGDEPGFEAPVIPADEDEDEDEDEIDEHAGHDHGPDDVH